MEISSLLELDFQLRFFQEETRNLKVDCPLYHNVINFPLWSPHESGRNQIENSLRTRFFRLTSSCESNDRCRRTILMISYYDDISCPLPLSARYWIDSHSVCLSPTGQVLSVDGEIMPWPVLPSRGTETQLGLPRQNSRGPGSDGHSHPPGHSTSNVRLLVAASLSSNLVRLADQCLPKLYGLLETTLWSNSSQSSFSKPFSWVFRWNRRAVGSLPTVPLSEELPTESILKLPPFVGMTHSREDCQGRGSFILWSTFKHPSAGNTLVIFWNGSIHCSVIVGTETHAELPDRWEDCVLLDNRCPGTTDWTGGRKSSSRFLIVDLENRVCQWKILSASLSSEERIVLLELWKRTLLPKSEISSSRSKCLD